MLPAVAVRGATSVAARGGRAATTRRPANNRRNVTRAAAATYHTYRYDTSDQERRRRTTDEQYLDERTVYNSVDQTRRSRLQRQGQQASKQLAYAAGAVPTLQPTALEQGVQKVGNLAGTVRRAAILAPTVVPGLYAHAALLGFWVISMAGLGLAAASGASVNWIPLVGEKLSGIATAPGMVLFMVGWVIAALIGVGTTCAVLIYCLMRGVVVFKTAWGLLAFIGALCLYLLPFTQWFPWYLAFGVAVTLAHK